MGAGAGAGALGALLAVTTITIIRAGVTTAGAWAGAGAGALGALRAVTTSIIFRAGVMITAGTGAAERAQELLERSCLETWAVNYKGTAAGACCTGGRKPGIGIIRPIMIPNCIC